MNMWRRDVSTRLTTWLGCLCAVAALGFSVLTHATQTSTTHAWMMLRSLPANAWVRASDVRTVDISAPAQVVSQLRILTPVGLQLARSVARGTLLTTADAMSAAHATPRFVTVAVQPDHLPAGLARGWLIDVWSTPENTLLSAQPGSRRVAENVMVADVSNPDAAGTMAVKLQVGTEQVGALVLAGHAGGIDLVEVRATESSTS